MSPGTIAKPSKGKNTKPGSNNKTTAKDKIGKVDSSKTLKTTGQQKKEVQENIQKLRLVLDDSRAQHEAYKQTLQELTKAYNNGAHPEYKDEYERKTKELDDMTRTLEGYKADLNELIAEQKGLEDMDGVEETGAPTTVTSGPTNFGLDPTSSNDPASSDPPSSDPASSLFVSSNPAGSSGQQSHVSNPLLSGFSNLFANPPANPPVINLIDEDGAPKSPNTDGDDDDAGLFTPEQNKVVTGRSDDGVVVAWRKQGYSKQVIIRYGPKNSPKYERSTKFKAGIPFDENTTPQTGPEHRFGDEKRSRKFVRQWDDFKGILGVAYNCPMEALMPREVSGEKKYPRVEVWVKWSIDGEIHRVWEVPSSIKHIWPNPTECEEYIYNTAREHDKKHQAWLSGQREGREASPTPGPETTRLMPKGPQTARRTIKVEEGGSNGTPPPEPFNSEEEKMLRYRRQWAMMKKLDSENLSDSQQLKFLKAWNETKDEEEL